MSKDSLNLLYPEWQGYGAHKQVMHGARHLCHHVLPDTSFAAIDVPETESLTVENGILGLSPSLSLLDQAQSLLNTANPRRIFTAGGTCACELAPIAYLNQKYGGDLAVFWFDAHGDLNTPESSPSGRLHGMPLRTLLGKGRRNSSIASPRHSAQSRWPSWVPATWILVNATT